MSTETQKGAKGGKNATAKTAAPGKTPANTPEKPVEKAQKGPQQEIIMLPPNVKSMLDQKQAHMNAVMQQTNAEIEMGIKFFLGAKDLDLGPDDIITLAPDNTQISIVRVTKKK